MALCTKSDFFCSLFIEMTKVHSSQKWPYDSAGQNGSGPYCKNQLQESSDQRFVPWSIYTPLPFEDLLKSKNQVNRSQDCTKYSSL